jgi:serine phosphatase RsbU (regulator of sigma subunit)
MARAFLRTALAIDKDPKSALVRVNHELERDIKKGMFVTVLMAVLDPDSGAVELYSAGSRLQAMRCVAGKAEWLHADGLALGLDKGAVFERTLRPQKFELKTGMRVALLNEGAAKLANDEGEAYGEEELLGLVGKHAPKNSTAFVHMTLNELELHAGEQGFGLDVAVVTAKRVR